MPASSLFAALLLDERVQHYCDLVIEILVGSEVDLESCWLTQRSCGICSEITAVKHIFQPELQLSSVRAPLVA